MKEILSCYVLKWKISDDPKVAQMVREMKQKEQQLDELLKESGWM